jgi:hypothetical protein
LVTRSGTNRYSGSLFEYFRNDKTDANDWFANRQALPKPPLRFNDFGGSLGGPVRIPHLYDGHDRTFFFLSVEDLVTLQPQPPVSFIVPTLQARQNAPPLVAALLNAYPLPNRSSSPLGDPAVTGFSEYAGSGSLKQDQQTWGLRLDHAFNDRFMSFVRYNRAPSNRLSPSEATSLTNITKYSLGTETLTMGLTQTLSPTLVNEVRLNGSRQSGTTIMSSTAQAVRSALRIRCSCRRVIRRRTAPLASASRLPPVLALGSTNGTVRGNYRLSVTSPGVGEPINSRPAPITVGFLR